MSIQDHYCDLGKRLVLAMERKAQTQTTLAALLGVHQTFISGIIRGTRPGRKYLQRIAELLDVPLEWLTTGYPEQPWAAGLSPAPMTDRAG